MTRPNIEVCPECAAWVQANQADRHAEWHDQIRPTPPADDTCSTAQHVTDDEAGQ